MLYLIGGLVLLVSLVYTYLRWNINYWKNRGVPSHNPRIFGSFQESVMQKKSLIYEIDELYNQYKDQTSFVGVFQVRQPRLLVTDTELVKSVLTKDFKNFQQNEFALLFDKSIDPIFGRNPFLLTGDEWKEKRAEITPAFTVSRIKAMYAIVEDVQRKMNKYILKELNNKSEGSFNAKELSAKFTIDVVSNCVYGVDSKAFTEEVSIIREMGSKLFQPNAKLLVYFTLITIMPGLQKILKLPIVSKDIEKFFTQLLADAIQLRKNSNTDQGDFLNYMLELQKRKNISDLDMAAHTLTFFLDGFETSNSVIAHVLCTLAENSTAQTKLRHEINEVINKKGEIKFEDIPEIEYLDAVFNETLRLYPPGSNLVKVCTETTQLTDNKDKKCLIEKGTPVILPVYSIHRDPRFYETPNEFHPERFMNGGLKSFREKNVFYPFGDGPRQCLGMRFATLQSKAAIIEIVSNFEILYSEKSQRPYVIDQKKFIIEPIGGLWINLRKIEK